MILIDRTLCCYCGTCVAVCPSGVLELLDACLTEHDGCTACSTCAGCCPVGALEVRP
ncbi:MAG: 4Fe-4S binding protein [Methanoregula sp.]